MREAVYISDGLRILPSPLGLEDDLNKFNLLFAFSNFYFFEFLFGTHWGYGYTSRAGAIVDDVSSLGVTRQDYSITFSLNRLNQFNRINSIGSFEPIQPISIVN